MYPDVFRCPNSKMHISGTSFALAESGPSSADFTPMSRRDFHHVAGMLPG
jgi:hypothetical protein